jgi:hypothetical protein
VICKFLRGVEGVRRHVAKYGTNLDPRSKEILREVIQYDIDMFQPILEQFKLHAKDAVPEAEAELKDARTLRASLEN